MGERCIATTSHEFCAEIQVTKVYTNFEILYCNAGEVGELTLLCSDHFLKQWSTLDCFAFGSQFLHFIWV